MIPPQAYPYLALVAVLALTGAYVKGRMDGADLERGAQLAAQESALKGQKAAMVKHYAKQKEVQIIYREKERIIRQAADPSNCADTALPVSILDGLY